MTLEVGAAISDDPIISLPAMAGWAVGPTLDLALAPGTCAASRDRTSGRSIAIGSMLKI